MIPWIEGAPETISPGQLLEMSDGAFIVVGHVNTVGGVCDHCTAGGGFAKAIVRHRVLWSGPDVEF